MGGNANGFQAEIGPHIFGWTGRVVTIFHREEKVTFFSLPLKVQRLKICGGGAGAV